MGGGGEGSSGGLTGEKGGGRSPPGEGKSNPTRNRAHGDESETSSCSSIHEEPRQPRHSTGEDAEEVEMSYALEVSRAHGLQV